MKRIKRYKWSIIVLVLQLAAAIVIGSGLSADAKVPMHWNIRGEIDGWSGVWNAVFSLWGIAFLVQALFFAFPWISPRYREQEERLEKILPDLSLLLALCFCALQIWSLHLAGKPETAFGNASIFLLVGLLFVGIGNIMPKIPRNYYIGVRLPWSLNDDDNWRKTHRLAGWCFAGSGVLIALGGLLPGVTVKIVVWVAAMLLLFIPVLYSYLLFRRSERTRP